MKGVSSREAIHILENQIRTLERELGAARQERDQAREHRRILREALAEIIADDQWDCACPEVAKRALAATKEEEKAE